MGLATLISNYSSFNEWANQKMVLWLKELDKEMLYRETPSSFDSIDKTIQHILRTQNFWLAFISEKNVSNVNWAHREEDAHHIMDELTEVSTQMKNKFSSYTDTDLLQTLHLNMSWASNSLCRYEYIVHVVNHSSFHRGQMVTMARCLGITEGIVNTDYNMFNSGIKPFL